MVMFKAKKEKALLDDPQKEQDHDYQVPNLERALLILEVLAQHHGGLTLSELVDLLHLPKNSIYRITLTLHKHGYLKRHDATRKFSLTRKMLALGIEALTEYSLLEISLDVMRELRDATRETVLLGVLIDDEGLVIEQVPGSHSFKFLVDAGTRFNLHTSAPGKAILANLPEPERKRMLTRLKLTRFNERTITSIKGMETELGQVRELGYAIDHAEEFDGIHCVGAAIRDQSGYPVAAMWVTCPSGRVPVESFPHFGAIVKAHAAKVSERLGFGIIAAAGSAD